MPFTFKPGQAPVDSNGVPVLVVPETPVISMAAPVEVISPFAYKNRGKSNFGVYFQGVVFLIFGVTLIATIGLFAYQGILKAQIEGKKNELAKAEKGMPVLPLDDMVKLSSRLGKINEIMGKRTSASAAFTILEESFVDDTVVYNKMTLGRSKSGNTFDLGFAGETNNYDSLYQQINALSDKKYSDVFTKINISGYGPLDKKGKVGFKVDSTVNIVGADSTFSIHKKEKATSTESVISNVENKSGSAKAGSPAAQ